MSQQTIYIKAVQNLVVYDKKVTLGDILKIECTNIGILRAVKQMDFYSFNHEHANVFSILKVIERIHKEYPNLQIVNCGEEDFVVEYKKSTVTNKFLEKIKLILVCVLVFFGSAFTIMTFHNDIGIEDVFERFYVQLMGMEKPMVTSLEISYSIGLGTGIILFFNHISKKKISHDPTPIEVELKKYNKDLVMTKIADMDEKGHKEDVT